MKIEISDLLNVINILKHNIVDSFPDGISIDSEDFYWEISEDDLYDPAKKPDDLTIGQLSDDWAELLRLKDQENIPISYDLKRLAVILQIIRRKSIGVW